MARSIHCDVRWLDLLSFFHDRLKVYLRDQGARHDLIDAVLASGGALYPPLEGQVSASQGGSKSERRCQDVTAHPAAAASLPASGRVRRAPRTTTSSPSSGASRRWAHSSSTDDGKNLLAGTKRAANILAAEEKKGTAIAAEVDPGKFRHPAEEALFAAVNQAESQAGQAIQNEDFSAAMLALSVLREPVDSFFEQVLVNDEDASVRANRLALLARIRAATDQVADFSRIAG